MDVNHGSSIHEDLGKILAHFIQDFMQRMKRQGLSTTQVHALMYVYHTGECLVSDIGDLSDASNAAASQLVERLVQQGWVERNEDPADRRTKILRLTEKGKEFIRSNIPSHPFTEGLLASLSTEQRKTVQAAFEILAQVARQHQFVESLKDGNNA